MLKHAWILSFIRFPMLAILIMFLLLNFLGLEFPFLPEMSTLYFTLVNMAFFVILYQILKGSDYLFDIGGLLVSFQTANNSFGIGVKVYE